MRACWIALCVLWAHGAQAAPSGTKTATLSYPSYGVGSRLSKAEYQPAKPPTAAEASAPQTQAEQLKRLRAELKYYAEGVATMAEDMRALVRAEFEGQESALDSRYAAAVGVLETEERASRADAIARFEAFLKKYPNNQRYTPDAMFRLAELYFERSAAQYLADSERYDKTLEEFDAGKRTGEPPAPPEPDYAPTIAMHKELLERFPNYRLADAARYLLGYCYAESGQLEQALAEFRELVRRYPKSHFAPEVWTRIGEIYFDGDTDESLNASIDAYRHVLNYPDSPYYDKALYKIAWAYYRVDRFGPAVKAFIRLVDYADKQKKETGVSGSELRQEAIQYIAVSLADEQWGGIARAHQVLDPLRRKPYAGEIWRRYGEVLYDQTRYPEAIQVMKIAIAQDPNAPYAPEAQEKIVRAYEQQRDFDGAAKAREELVAKYSAGSKWSVQNEGDEAALSKADELTEKSLYSAAIFRHQQAQSHKGAGRMKEALASYRAAAKAYEAYLKRFPDAKNSYDFEFYLAECLYYAGDYDRAAAQYDKVRDSKKNNTHLEPAALSSVLTYEKAIEDGVKSKQLKAFPLQTAAERGDRPVSPQPLDAARQALVMSSDRFAILLPNSKETPNVQYRAAEVYYRHDQLDEARRRFELIVREHPDSQAARYASNLIIESYLALKDWDKVEEWSDRLLVAAQSSKKGKASDRAAFVKELKSFKVGAQFKKAELADEAGDYETAARTYVALVDENPKHEFADKALFNAALAFEKAKRFDSATKTYQRIYREYPRSELAPRSLFRVGVNADKGFDFPAAVAAYDQLAERYPKSKHRVDAMYNRAVVLENMQDYSRAAKADIAYAEAFPRRPDAGEMYFRAALVYEKMKAYPMMVRTLQDFTERYRRQRKERARMVRAYEKIGDAYRAEGRSSSARRSYEDCVEFFRMRRLSTRSEAGKYAAHCALELAEDKFASYNKLKIRGSGRALVRSLKKKAQAQLDANNAYRKVFPYKRVEPTLAASYRIGNGYERMAEALFTAPVPKELRRDEDAAMEYRAQLEDRAATVERKAEAAYRKAYKEAQRTKVSNQWTEKILEGLNKYAPQEFPLQKAGKAMLQRGQLSGGGLDSSALPKKAAAPKAETAPQEDEAKPEDEAGEQG